MAKESSTAESDALKHAFSQGASIVRLQDESMQAIAIQRPRDIETVKNSAIAEVEAFPEQADRYFYSIPYRTTRCDHPIGKMCPTCEMVEGPSVHAALALQRYWGNCTSSWRVDSEDADHVWLVGVFLDYQTNTRFEKSFRASKKIRKRDGTTYPLNDQKLTMAMNAAGSKAQRNAIMAGVPDPLKIMILSRAKQLAVGENPSQTISEKQVGEIVKAFGTYNVTLELLVTKLGVPSDQWTMAHRSQLKGLYNALVDGEASEELFGPTVKQTKAKPKATKQQRKAAKKPEPEPEVVQGEVVPDDEPPPGEAFGDNEEEQAPSANPFDNPDLFS